MVLRFLILATALALVGCEWVERDDSWSMRSKFRRGDLVIYRLDGAIGMVHGSSCSRTECTYKVETPKLSYGLRVTHEYEIDKSPQQLCNDKDRLGQGVIVFQKGDHAAEARCWGTWRGEQK